MLLRKRAQQDKPVSIKLLSTSKVISVLSLNPESQNFF